MILLMGFSIRVDCNFTSKAKKCTELIDSATSSKSVSICQDYVFFVSVKVAGLQVGFQDGVDLQPIILFLLLPPDEFISLL